MFLFDVALLVDKKKRTHKILWVNDGIKEICASLWELAREQRLEELLPVGPECSGEFVFQMNRVSYHRLMLDHHTELILLQLSVNFRRLYELALEQLPQGVEIYDRNGYILYLNEASRQIYSLPPREELLGKHLLDIWNVKDEVSTALSCLRTRAPIQNRIGTTLDANKGNITTVNSAYPILDRGRLEGAVLFEWDLETFKRHKDYLLEIEKGLKQHAYRVSAERMSGYNFECIIGESEALKTAVNLARRFSIQDCNIMLVGETGTGKEIFAQSIHRASTRKEKNFVAINCAAVPETLIESMLFGTQKGAFTGSENKAGLFEEANGGTLFLDEINSMSLAMQSKLLRVVQEGIFRRVGSTRDCRTDVRIISSSNEDPFALVDRNSMRRDLFYRLSTVQIRIPPLRERLEDLSVLVTYYFNVKKIQFAKRMDYVSPEVMELFRSYPWPGNVRELFHVLDYAINVVEEGVITTNDLPEYLVARTASQQERPALEAAVPQQDVVSTKLEDLLGAYEHAVILQVLEHYGYNISRSAQSLGICRQSLAYRIKKYGIVC